MQLSQFINSQKTLVGAMDCTMGKADRLLSDISDLEKEQSFRESFGHSLILNISDRQIVELLDGKKRALKSILCQYADQAHQLVEGMQKYEEAEQTEKRVSAHLGKLAA